MTWSWSIFIIGCVGGLIPDVMRVIQKRHEPELPTFLWSANFWVGLILLVLVGGVAAIIGQAADWKQALAIGYAGPEFLSRALASKPVTLSSAGSAAVIRRWWAF